MFLLLKCTILKNKKANYMMKKIFLALCLMVTIALPGYADLQISAPVPGNIMIPNLPAPPATLPVPHPVPDSTPVQTVPEQPTLSPEDLVSLAFQNNMPLPGNVSLIDALAFILSKIEGVNIESKEFLEQIRVQIQQNRENTEALTAILGKMRDAFRKNQFVFLAENSGNNFIKK